MFERSKRRSTVGTASLPESTTGLHGMSDVAVGSMPRGPGETTLVNACVGGDEQSWRLLHRRYFRIAASFLRAMGVRDHDLEDAAQDVFLELFRYLPRFRGDAELSTWLYRLCITQARRTRRRARVSDALGQVLSLLPGAEVISTPSFSEDAARRRIHSALGGLSEHERAVFVLYELEGVPGKRIASILECPEATVWRRLHYARKRFRAALGVSEAAD